jgi:UDP-glucose:glycoprotein glucosyltransferase
MPLISTFLQVYVVVDPLTLAGQRAAGLIRLLQQQLRLPVTLLLLPRPEITDFPLQNFYRYVLSPHDYNLDHDHDTSSATSSSTTSSAAKAVFQSLPRQHTLTVRIDAPEPWNIQATSAIQVGHLHALSACP